MKINHSSYAWKETKNRMVLSDPNKNYAKTVDKDGMSSEQRKKINQYKYMDIYGDMVDREVWDE